MSILNDFTVLTGNNNAEDPASLIGLNNAFAQLQAIIEDKDVWKVTIIASNTERLTVDNTSDYFENLCRQFVCIMAYIFITDTTNTTILNLYTNMLAQLTGSLKILTVNKNYYEN